MADGHRIQINEPTEAETVSLEQRHAELVEQGVISADDGENESSQENTQKESPEWLPDKFKSPEELAIAYKELEKRQSSGESAEGAEENEGEPSEITAVFETATAEYNEKGQLSEQTFAALAEQGISKDVVDSYIAGQQAISAQQTAQIYDAVGGESTYSEVIEWASDNLADSEIDAYNAILQTGTMEQAAVAAKGLHAQYQASQGAAPTLRQGATSGEGIMPFNSVAQVSEAMRDKRYQNDPAYRQTVEKRLAISDVL